MAKPFEFNDFYCTQCGNKGIPIVRKSGAAREAGHLKKLFCLTCGTETNHVECKPNTKYTYDDFLKEFDGGNFTPTGKRYIEYSEFKQKLNRKELISNE